MKTENTANPVAGEPGIDENNQTTELTPGETDATDSCAEHNPSTPSAKTSRNKFKKQQRKERVKNAKRLIRETQEAKHRIEKESENDVSTGGAVDEGDIDGTDPSIVDAEGDKERDLAQEQDVGGVYDGKTALEPEDALDPDTALENPDISIDGEKYKDDDAEISSDPAIAGERTGKRIPAQNLGTSPTKYAEAGEEKKESLPNTATSNAYEEEVSSKEPPPTVQAPQLPPEPTHKAVIPETRPARQRFGLKDPIPDFILPEELAAMDNVFGKENLQNVQSGSSLQGSIIRTQASVPVRKETSTESSKISRRQRKAQKSFADLEVSQTQPQSSETDSSVNQQAVESIPDMHDSEAVSDEKDPQILEIDKPDRLDKDQEDPPEHTFDKFDRREEDLEVVVTPPKRPTELLYNRWFALIPFKVRLVSYSRKLGQQTCNVINHSTELIHRMTAGLRNLGAFACHVSDYSTTVFDKIAARLSRRDTMYSAIILIGVITLWLSLCSHINFPCPPCLGPLTDGPTVDTAFLDSFLPQVFNTTLHAASTPPMPSDLLVRARELYIPTMSGSYLTQLGAFVDAFIAAKASVDKALTDFHHQATASGAEFLALKPPKARLLLDTVSSFISNQALAVPRIQESLDSIPEVLARGHAVQSFNEVYGGFSDHRTDWWFPWYHFRDMRREQQQQDLERDLVHLAGYHRTQKERLQTVSLEFRKLQEELVERSWWGWRDNRLEEEVWEKIRRRVETLLIELKDVAAWRERFE